MSRRSKPKPEFEWAELDAVISQTRPAALTRKAVKGGFTVLEMAKRKGITREAAHQRIKRYEKNGIVKKVAQVEKVGLDPEGRRWASREWVYNVVKVVKKA